MIPRGIPLTYLAQVKQISGYSPKMCRFVLLKNALIVPHILLTTSEKNHMVSCKDAVIVGLAQDAALCEQNTNMGESCKAQKTYQNRMI